MHITKSFQTICPVHLTNFTKQNVSSYICLAVYAEEYDFIFPNTKSGKECLTHLILIDEISTDVWQIDWTHDWTIRLWLNICWFPRVQCQYISALNQWKRPASNHSAKIFIRRIFYPAGPNTRSHLAPDFFQQLRRYIRRLGTRSFRKTFWYGEQHLAFKN